jgi:GrpB-like predicted nucleotidyltransferase (UPF0157 family)
MKITLTSYDPKWQIDFEQEKEKLTGLLET